jgi:hypothetical protein
LVQTGTLIIDRLGKFEVTYPRPFAGTPTFIFPREQFTGPGRFAVQQSTPTGFTIDVSDAAFTPTQPVRIGWLATGQPAPPPSPASGSQPAPNPAATTASGAEPQDAPVPDRFVTGVLNDEVRWTTRAWSELYRTVAATLDRDAQRVTWTLQPKSQRDGLSFEFHAVLYDQQGQRLLDDAPLDWSPGRQGDQPVVLASLDLRWLARRLGDTARQVAAVTVESFAARPYGRLREGRDRSAQEPERIETGILADDVAWRHKGFHSGFEVLEVSFDPATRQVTWVMELLPRTYASQTFRVGFYDKSGVRLEPPAPLVWRTGQRDGHTIDFAVLDLGYFAERLGDRCGSVANVTVERYDSKSRDGFTAP